MKNIKAAAFIFLFTCSTFYAQIDYKNQLVENSVFSSAPEEIKHSKAFVRQWVFFDERAYPNNYIPVDAYEKAQKERDALRIKNKNVKNAVNWVNLGPTPGNYPGYGSISSRIVTGSYHPVNSNIIYIGAANGGVWKTTDAGINWQPLTDNQPSLSMGAIVIDSQNPSVIYAGTGEATYSGASYYGRGLLKSTDAGQTWLQITSGLPSSTYFSRLVIRPNFNNELLAALGTSGLYRSSNGGLNWSQIVSGRCDDVLFTPSGDTAFAVGSGIGGIRRSIDGGKNFSTFATGFPSTITRVHFDLCYSVPSVMYAVVHASSDITAWKSTDNGKNWFQISSATNFNGSQAWYDLYLKVNPVNPDVAFIGAVDIFRTTNGSEFTNITNGYSGGTVHVDQHYLFFHPTDPQTFICCNDGGIWRSTNSGTSFFNLNDKLTLTQFYRIAASPFTPSRILGGTQDNGTQQTLSTLNWAAVFGGDGGEVCFNPFDNRYILAETQNGGIRRTGDGGSNWASATSGITTSESVAWVAPIIAHPTTSGIFYTARQRVYKSTNNGVSWIAISGNVNSTSAVREMAISKSKPELLYASTGSLLFKSVDGGINWTSVSTGLPAKTISSVYVHPDSANIVVVTFLGFGGAKIYKSIDEGNTWSSINGDLPDSPISDVFIYTEDNHHPNTYFVATDIGVFYTQDNGNRWYEITEGLPNTVIKHLDYSPSTHTLRAGTHGRGVYEAYIDFYLIPVELTSFSVSNEGAKIKLEWETATESNNSGFQIERKLKNCDWQSIGFVKGKGTTTEKTNYSFIDNMSSIKYEGKVLYRLKQIDFNGSSKYSNQVFVNVNNLLENYLSNNYPNPFNPVTTIRYGLKEESLVKISVFNSLGEKIQTLIEQKQEAGYYEINWNASGRSSGIYFYLIEVRNNNGEINFSEIRKLVLLK